MPRIKDDGGWREGKGGTKRGTMDTKDKPQVGGKGYVVVGEGNKVVRSWQFSSFPWLVLCSGWFRRYSLS